MNRAHRKKNGKMRCPFPIDCRRPTWRTFYWLGVEASKQLAALDSWEAIGREVGLTKQNTFTQGMLALGKVVYAMRERRKGVE